MRKIFQAQLTFDDQEFLQAGKFFTKDEELEKISRVLDDSPEILERACQDLTAGLKNAGNNGMSVEQVLRCAVLYQMKDYSYRELQMRINSDYNYRKFTRFYSKPVPDFTNLAKAVGSIKPQTYEALNDLLVLYAKDKGLEDGSKVRSDGAVVQTDIHHPTDSSLLWDSVRVLDRIMNGCRTEYTELQFEYHDRTRVAKKRSYEITMAKGKGASKKRKKAYRNLLKTSEEVLAMARACRDELDSMRVSAGWDINMGALIDELDHYIPLAEKVIDQCRRRVFEGEEVPAHEKVVSIFEEHTDIIMRGKTQSPTEFGHKVVISTGASGIVTQYKVCEGNPSDGDMVGEILDKHVSIFGDAPDAFAGDRRFYSKANEELAGSAPYNIEYISIPKPGRRSPERKEFERAKWFKTLQRFRAGIEGILSALLRALGLGRCLWSGFRSFRSYVGLSVFAFNLRKIASLL